MRQLIDVEFIDNSSYSDNTTNDVVGMVLPHTWGPVDKVTSVAYTKFLQLYPVIATPAYALADSCFNAGAGMMEIVRPQGKQTYFHGVLFTGKGKVDASIDNASYVAAYGNVASTGLADFDAINETIVASKANVLNNLKLIKLASDALKCQIQKPALTVTGTPPENVDIAGKQDPTVNYGVVANFDGNTINFSGIIPWYAANPTLGRTEGNRVGVAFTAPDDAVLASAKFTLNGKSYDQAALEDVEGKKVLNWWPLVTAGQSLVATLDWKGDGTSVTYTISIAADANLMSSDPETTYSTLNTEAQKEAITAAIPNIIVSSDWVGGVAPEKASDIVAYMTTLTEGLSTIIYIPASDTGINSASERQMKINFDEKSSKIPNIETVVADITQKYPGNIPLTGPLSVGIDIARVDGAFNVGVSLYQGTGSAKVAVESYVGGVVPGEIQDGKSFYINDVVNTSNLIRVNFDATAEELAVLLPGDEEYTAEIAYTTIQADTFTEEDIIAYYAKYFSSCELSRATLLIPTFEEEKLNNAVINAAAKRMDCNAIVGYPTTEPFTLEDIKAFLTLMNGDKFGMFYAGRDTYKISGKSMYTSCVGKIAGRYCAVTMDAGLNQVPSSLSYGTYPGSLVETLSSDEVLDLQKQGGNSVYSTANGPYIWGIKTLHTRQSSYFAKANVMRLIANILYTTFPYLESVHHTPNTDRKKMMVQNNRQSYLDQLAAAEQIKPDSAAICNSTNNTDLETNAGEILILDLNIGFIKLIERFKVRIQATDSTITAVEV